MARVAPFEAHTQRYENWFSRHAAVYPSELDALASLLQEPGFGLEIGIGTGRFATPLGLAVGVDPSLAMLRKAQARGVATVCGIAEALPFREGIFDSVLIVTTICFLDDAAAMLAEAHRVLTSSGTIVIGFIDRTSRLGRHYEAHRAENVFYRHAVFFSSEEVDVLLARAGFGPRRWLQTLTRPLAETTAVEPTRPGVGAGAFVAVQAGVA